MARQRSAVRTSAGELPGDFEPLRRWVTTRVDRLLERRLGALVREARRHGVAATAEAAAALVLRGGKRFRATLTVVACAGLGRRPAPIRAALEAGAALELFHAYLLVQDDWMDGDRERRGGPSVHAALAARYRDEALGASSAVLASDLLWGAAIEQLGALPISADRRLEAIGELCRCHRQVIFGQELDLLGARTPHANVATIHALKTTSYTASLPLRLGALVGGAAQFRALDAVGRTLGQAFQLRDDLLGAFGASAATGKPFAGDIRAGKLTAVTAEASRHLRGEDRRLFARAFGLAGSSERTLVRATRVLEHAGVRRELERRLRRTLELARRRVRALPIDLAAKRWLDGAVAALEALSEPPSPALPPSGGGRLWCQS